MNPDCYKINLLNIITAVYVTQIQDQLVLFGCEIWSLTLRKEYKLQAFENHVLKKISEPRWMKQVSRLQYYIRRNLMICIGLLVLLGY
jgi:hypothetical protein